MSRAVRIVFGALWVFSAPVVPADPGDFTITSWTVESDLPLDTVRGLMQTSDLYLWVATPNGLASFDGERFVRYEAAVTETLPNNLVTAMYESGAGDLWLGLETGEIVRRARGRFEVVRLPGDWPRLAIDRMLESGAGEVVVLSHGGAVAGVRGDGFEWMIARDDANPVSDLIPDRDGRIWALCPQGFLELVEGELVTVADAPPPPERPAMAFPARAGGLWISEPTRLRRWRGGEWAEEKQNPPPLNSNFPIALEAADGTLVGGSSRQGVYLLSPGGDLTRLGSEHGLGSNRINCVMEDHEGGIWVGTSGGGLSRIQRRFLQQRVADTATGRPTLLSVDAADDGALWMGTEGEGVLRLSDGEWRKWTELDGLRHPMVRTVLRDRQGVLWAGTNGGGVYRLSGERFEPDPGWERRSDDVTCLHETADGRLYAGTRSALMQRVGARWRLVEHGAGAVFANVRSIASGPDGVLWIGTAGSGLLRVDGEGLKRIGRDDGLGSDNIWALLADAEEPGVIWVGTQGDGLVRLRDGKLSPVNSAHGLPGNTICSLVDDGAGWLWISTYEGIVALKKEELHACADRRIESVTARVFGAADGLVSSNVAAGTQPTACRASDGTIWFATAGGLAGVDPALALSKPIPQAPPLKIERVRVDGREPDGWREAGVAAGPGVSRLEVDYGAVSFSAPGRVRARYRMVGLDDDWVEVGGDRSIRFDNLPPGDYLLEVEASSTDGAWNGRPSLLPVRLEPYLWQRPGVRISGGLLLLGLTFGLTRRRQKRKVRELRQQNALERERSRIARDIHDELGASLTRISMLGDAGAAEPGLPERARSTVDEISRCARSSVAALDEIVWAVNPRHDTLEGLLDYLSHYCHDFLEETDISLVLDFPSSPPALPVAAEIRYGVLLLVKEALNNVVKHAQAGTVTLSIRERDGVLGMVIRDDGRGVAEASPGRHGIEGMRERVAGLDGDFHLHGEGGTTLDIRIPLRHPKNR